MVEPETVIFYVSSISAVFILVYFFKLIKLRSENRFVKNSVQMVAIIVLSMLIIDLGFMIGQFDDLYRVIDPNFDLNEYLLYSINYAIYFLLWILGNYVLSLNIIQEPKNKKIHFKYVRYFLFIEILLCIILVFTIIGFGVFTSSDTIDDYYEFIFVIISQLALFTFIYFYWVLKREAIYSKSLLNKARIHQIKKSIATQIIMSISITIGAVILFLDIESLPSPEVQMVLLSWLSLLAALCSYYQYSSIIIPKKIRETYNISNVRFKEITKLFDEEP